VTDGVRENGARYIKADATPNYEAAFGNFFHDEMVIGVDRMMSIGAVLSTPAVVADTIVFGSMDGNVYALAPRNPAERRHRSRASLATCHEVLDGQR
jgi:outer membrane protein assembly factor BamB